jgi:isopenicillin-N N-acyltransferase-like protein
VALEGRVRGNQVLALCQNWDWDPVLADAPVVLRLRPTNGPALVTMVEAGMIGKIGFNEYRLGVCLNFLSHKADGGPDTFGVPIHCLLRATMDCETVEEAVATVESAPRCASANFMLAQHDASGPHSLDLEICPDAIATLEDDASGLVHTNHFLDPELAEGCTSGRGPSTMTRFATARKLAADLRPTVPDPVRRARIVLESRHNLPYPISRVHNPDPSSSTLAGIIMDLTHNRLILTRGAPHRNEWVDLPGV